MIGIPFLVNLQERAMTETMGPIYDRTRTLRELWDRNAPIPVPRSPLRRS